MEKKPVNQVIQEHKETVRTYIERVIDFEKVNRDRLFREAEEELKETCKKQGIPLMEIVK